jgi:quinoprotein glucose dehydrogenase
MNSISKFFAIASLLALSAMAVAQEAPGPDPKDTESAAVESASQRAQLPLYKTIPAAKDAELTPAAAMDSATGHGWQRSNADASNTRYSALSQINKNNVSRLRVAWIYHSGGKDRNNIQTNPVIVDGIIYAPTVAKAIVALNAQTGRELWRFVPPAATELFGENYLPAHRGLAYWPGTTDYKPRLFFTANGYLYALDPLDGTLVAAFGDHGTVHARGPVAPAIYKDVIVVSDLDALEAFKITTGQQLWRFEVDAQGLAKGLGDSLLQGKVHRYPGGSIWGGIALDEARGLVFIATGAPHPNFVGVNRIGRNEHTNSIVALDVRSGHLVWAFQDIAHDLWDLDIPAPPNLVTIMHHAKRVDAVAQVTKQGNTLLLDRLTGKPLFPFRLRRAPVSTVPGERTSPYQPDLELPQPFSRQVFTTDDITTITPEAHEFVSKQLQDTRLGWFEPPMEDRPVVYYGVHGGAEWTGAAFDPTSGWLYVSANEIAWLARITRAEERPSNAAATPGQMIFLKQCAQCHGNNREGRGVAPSLLGIKRALTNDQVSTILEKGRNAMPPISISEEDRKQLLDFLFDRDIVKQDTFQAGPSWFDRLRNFLTTGSNRRPVVAAPFVDGGLNKLLDQADYPGTKPPWGTLSAIDLNTGKLAWQVPLGEYEELIRRGIPKTGTENFGGAMVTAGGLVFCAGTRDHKIRAFDKDTGQELWEYKLPYGGYAPPATYEVDGRQYVVIAATGGGKLGGEHGDVYVAFAVPASASGVTQ